MKSIDTALRILSLFKDEEHPLGVTDVVDRLEIGKSHASRVLAAMRDVGYLSQHPATRKYTVGLEAFAVGARFITNNPMTRSALPVMRACSEATGHSVFVSVRHGASCRHILAFEGPHFADSQWRIGIRLSLHATASGKLLLAFSPEGEREALVADAVLERHTPNTLTDRQDLHAELAAIRARGWSAARGETVMGLAACAVPIYAEKEAVVAAFGVVAPADLLPEAKVAQMVDALHASARRLSYLLGARAYPH